ncbi:MAG: hypothetical protein A2Y25_03110 [Candidatus Melainabacteria bacterium GWF2_37_15]|nr:MAG: hypothetical protein A2Y25_03110 [Candidatus Melainabacteria bacterium GWF2_37_15]
MDKQKFENFIALTQKAFLAVTEELISCNFKPVATYSAKSNHTVTVIIGITGKGKGRILLECDLTTAEKFAVAMNFGDALESPNDMYLYMAEFANMVSGRAATYINNETGDRDKWLSPPSIFSGENLEIITPNIESQEVYYSGDVGLFKINIGLGE